MNPKLRTALLSGPKTAKELAVLIEQPVSVTKALLKDDQATIRCRKNDDQQNIFWLEADDFEASPAELAAQATRQDLQAQKAVKTPEAPTPTDTGPTPGTDTCPLCQAEAEQVQAGPTGSYLGACRTCAACKKTYNVFSKEEIKMAKDKTTETKRAAPLNPQYKINAKIDMAEKAGGKLVYQREGRTWLLSKKGVDPKQMTAVEFSNETPETIAKYLGFTPPAAPPKAEKAPKAEKTPKAAKPAKAAKAAKPAKAKSDKELVGA